MDTLAGTSFFIESIDNKNSTSINFINEATLSIDYELFKEKRVIKPKPKLGCLLILVALFTSGELDFDGSTGPINHLSLHKANGDKIDYKRVRKGISIKKGDHEIGSLKFKKREFICKYEVKVGDSIIGRLVPNGIAHNEMEVLADGAPTAKFTRSKSVRSKYLGELEINATLSEDELLVIMGGIFFWV